MNYDSHIEKIAKAVGVEEYKIRAEVDVLINEYRKKLIENYIVGAAFKDFEIVAGCKFGIIGEVDGYVVITKSRNKAVQAIKVYEEDSGGGDVDLKPKDLSEGMLWTYKRPEHEGGEFEFYYDFDSKHPKAKHCFYYYI